ncbi:MAG TPA: energy transducer TonB [Dyella sp.]|uniref:energy transducer TonB family protein n=1 Tax=Dyella sp. TaxID=1869338 RepID=UPI002D78E0E1|nr:energy transducer TonB [Dyella sp.]HET6552476.1 energy transducer TonB [Dyella sp.]
MFRLRTTTTLSVLALVVGIAGTAWLSTLTDDWKGPAARAVTHVDKVRTVLRRHARTPRPASQPEPANVPTVHAEAAPELPTLTPIDMPSLPVPLFERVAMANGRVVLQLSVDGEGRVRDASVAESSGNDQWDDRAVRTVLRWRFAVPTDAPDGLTGQLVMRFDATGSGSSAP